jgi:hypothetical protein
MDNIAIQLEEKNGMARINEPVSLGIPLPKGAVRTTNNLVLMDEQRPLGLQLAPLAHWPDGSIRWVHASFLIRLDPNSKKFLMLAQRKISSFITPEPVIKQTTEGLVIDTSSGSVALQPNRLTWQAFNNNHRSFSSTVILSDDSSVPCMVKAETNWAITHKGIVFVAATLKGEWLKQNGEPLARFQCELRIFLETGLIQVELVTHNPKRTRHPGGLWDLGDPGSVCFRELAIETTLPATSKAKVTPQAIDENSTMFHCCDFNLYQDSSGGENWQSRNHVGANGKITTQFCGYRLTSASGLQYEGKRANPIVNIEHDYGQLNLTVPNFWQNFPTSLRKEKNKLTIGLFPKDAKDVYELQGGERKTLSCSMAYHSDNSLSATAYTPLVPVLAPECYERADAFPWFKANTQPDALDKLIAEGLDGKSNFFAKREVIDEFGWRNFGDIFADHETLYQNEGEPPFISHYNNQYDPIYGFARQYALTGDERWFQLMDDLAHHVLDIDIYHTDEDRTEYNNGLFWHTDHYLDAYSATHRTFSRQNDTSSTPGQTGGGPAAEHCYTTGLLYHYYLTGAEQSRQAVLQLAGWIRAIHEGQGGLLEQLLAMKKQDLPKALALIRGENPTPHTYPFTRGTGNYLNALLDAWQLQPDSDWLRLAERVIRQTIHPADDIAMRQLLDVETGWSYLILLTSISRYLWLKTREDQIDENYRYAREALIHYTRWVLEHERLFLNNADQLEFPNDTWTAQDIRKVMLLRQAASVDSAAATAYLQKSEIWLQEICQRLATSDERHYARVLIILLQNHGPHQIETRELEPATLSNIPAAPRLTWQTLTGRVAMRLARAMFTFRFTRERAWLSARMDRP